MVKRVGKYDIGKTLGEGTFGKVKFAINTETGEKVAIKILDKERIQKQNMGAQIKKEISIMKMVKHPHVVKLYEVLASRTKIFIVLELITAGELFDKIVAEGRFDENKARFYFRQLMCGVKYCQSQGVCHRDLKPENLLLDGNADLKISDFGLSALYTGSPDDEGRATLLHTTCGTPNYVAPEVLNDKGYDGKAADIWSAGVILYVLLAGFLPFDEPHMSALFRKIQKAEFTYPSWFSPQVRSLIDSILVADPTKRATVADIEAHPWFIGPDGYHDTCETTASSGGGAGAGGDELEGDGIVEDVADDGPAASSGRRSSVTTPAAAPAPAAASGPQPLNAFDVVNMFGGLALNRLMAASSDRRRLAYTPQFLSTVPADTILSRIEASLRGLGAEPKVDRGSCKIKAKMMTGRGEIAVVAVIYRLNDSLFLVEIHRGKGDILEYNNAYMRLRESLADLVASSSFKA